MSAVVHLPPPSPPARLTRPTRPDDGASTAARRGWVVIALFFGVLGVWSLLAPLDGAVIAEAVVKVEGNRKPIQHLEGGIVRQIRVHDGDGVEAGDILIVLDDVQARAELEVLDKLATVLLLTKARLEAEQEESTGIVLPPPLAARFAEPGVAETLRRQSSELTTRRREREGQSRLIAERIAQIESQATGARAQLDGLERQRVSIHKEQQSLSPLLERGIVTRGRLIQLERSLAALDGQAGETRAAIARAEQAIAEQRQIEVQSRTQRAAALAQEARDVEMRLAEVSPKLANARAVHARTVVKAPYAGRVVGLNVFAVGAVIGRGERLMDIVPEGQSLVVEARLAVEDVGELLPGAAAEVRLTGYKQQTTPPLAAAVTHISADRLTDERSGRPYYLAEVRIAPGAVAAAPQIHLQPGMPASVTIPTSSRTAFQYLIAPLRASFHAALRER